MYDFKAEGLEALEKKLDALGKQIEELHKQIPVELFEWQRVDMRRQYPNMQVEETAATVTATTEIWPRSRLEQPGSGYTRPAKPTQLRIKGQSRGPRQYLPKVAGPGRPPPSTRPILRDELFIKLGERIDARGKEAMKWP